jgi:cation diffusion facilitator family transporter
MASPPSVPPTAPSASAAPTAHRWLTPRHLLAASIVVAGLTIALKTLAWHVTGSVGLLSDAMESFVNLASAIFALAMVTVAARPADEDHPFGHHKAEYFSSGFEGLLIVGVALGIVWTSVHRLFHPQPLEQVGWGLVLSVASSALNGGLAWLMFRSARQYRSIALEADARHLVTDVWTSVGVVVGIVGAAATGWLWLDAVAALAVAGNIFKEGCALVWRSSQGLMDQAVEPQVQQCIDTTLRDLLAAQPPDMVRCDDVATRRAGQRQFVDLHLHMPGDWTLRRAALLRAEVERALMAAVPGLRATIVMLPSDMEAYQDDDRPPPPGAGPTQEEPT